MKNIIKMSLVAAVAVAGFTSTVSAQPLEEAIKGVDFSGSLRYRYTNGESKLEKNDYRLQLITKAKVNDNVTAKVALNSNNGTTNASGDANPTAAEINEANFIVNAAGATVIIGKQALATPFADGSLDSQQGTGIVAMYPVGPVTLAAGWYTNSDASSIYNGDLNTGDNEDDNDLGGSNITALGVIGSVEAINYSLWYANVSESSVYTNGSFTDAEAGADAFNVNVDATFGPISVELNHASVDYSLNSEAEDAGLSELNPKQTRVVASFDAEVAKLTAGVIFAGQDGATVDLGDGDAQSNFAMEAFDARDLRDTTAYYLGVKAPVGPVTLGLEHGRTTDVDGSDDNGDTSFSETKFSASYAMSKNFTVSGWLTETSGDDDYDQKGANRIEVKYTF